MASPVIVTGTVWEDGGASMMARVVGNAGANIVQADIQSIARNVFIGTTLDAGPTALTVATVVFDTLQTDARWSIDSTGYNFRDDVAAAIFATGDTRYRLEYAFTPASGEVFQVVFEAKAKAIHTS